MGNGRRRRAVARARRAVGPGRRAHHAVDGEPLRHGARPLPRQRRQRHRLRLVPRRGHRGRPHVDLRVRGHAPHAVAAGRPQAAPSRSTGAATRWTSRTLVQDVFVGRMSGPILDTNQISATLQLDRRAAAPHAQRADRHGGRRARQGALQRRVARGVRHLPRRSQPHEQPDGRRRHGRQVPGPVARRHRDARAVTCTTAARRR